MTDISESGFNMFSLSPASLKSRCDNRVLENFIDNIYFYNLKTIAQTKTMTMIPFDHFYILGRFCQIQHEVSATTSHSWLVTHSYGRTRSYLNQNIARIAKRCPENITSVVKCVKLFLPNVLRKY